MMLNQNKKRFGSLLLAVIMLATAGLIPAAAAGSENDNAAREWETDIRLSIATESQLSEESGMNPAAWDGTVRQMKQAGLDDPLTAEAILEADESASILEEDGKVYYVGASSLFAPVTDAPEAYRLAYRLVGMLGGSALTELLLKSRLTINETTIYSFQQIFDGETVLGGVLKIATDRNNAVTAVFSSIDPESSLEQTLLSREEAEDLVISQCAENGLSPDVLARYTERSFICPVSMAQALNLDEDLDPVPDQLVWVVYTLNKGDGAEQPDLYPYLAHYVQVNGNYLYRLPVAHLADAEALCGYRKPDVFAGLKADSYTGEITDLNGRTREITVPVMYSEADGCWYLGDVERRIAFADFAEAAYGENHDIVLLKSEDNSWDTEDIYTFYNYLRAWNFYADMGWIGPDGQETDVLIFKGMAYSNGMVYENACSVGLLNGWQAFAYSPYSQTGEPLRMTWGLDVMAHEFTHTFTGTVMNENLYENDLGAINEAMSDIMGNLIEYICRDTEDTIWSLGENTGNPIRCMSDPERFGQPSYVWGLYYGPMTDEPNTINDRGGVHFNSSLLNLIAASLCLDYGMSYEDAVSFWLMTAMGMTPRTDYPQMVALMNWALEQTGNSETYQEALNQLIAQTRIGSTDLPDTLPEGQKLVRLDLPDTEAFRSKDWVLFVEQFDVKTKSQLRDELADYVVLLLSDPEARKSFTDNLKHLMEEVQLKVGEFDIPSLFLNGSDDPEQENPLSSVFSDLITLAEKKASDMQTTVISWEETDTGVIPAVIKEEPSLYFLMNVSPGGSQLNKIVVLIGNSWYDLSSFSFDENGVPDAQTQENLIAIAKSLGIQALANLFGSGDVWSDQAATSDPEAAWIEYLPTAGLENIQPVA